MACSVDTSSKFTGRRGAVVALYPDGDSQVEHLRKACEEAGFVVQQGESCPLGADGCGAVKFISFIFLVE